MPKLCQKRPVLCKRKRTLYNLYSRTSGGKTRYYYEFYDQTGTRVRRSTGCTKKSEAVAFINRLEFQEEQKKKNATRMTFKAYVSGFFDPGPILSRWSSHGKVLKADTIKCHKAYLEHYLLPWFGDLFIDEISAKKLDTNLMKAKWIESKKKKKGRELSGSTKNCIKDTLTVILKEALFDEKITIVPSFKIYARNSKRQNTLTDAELTKLFSFDQGEAVQIWKMKSDLADTRPALMFEVMAAVAVSCGLRSGEVVALSFEQIFPGKGLLIDRVLEKDGTVSFPKKGTADDPRYRVVPVSDYTLSLLNQWIDANKIKSGRLFSYHGEAVTGDRLLRRFKSALKEAGISTENRRITFHGLRYTYNTKMKSVVPHDMLRDIIGHRSEEMTDLYDRPVMEKRLDEYRETLMPAVNGFWKAQ